MWVGGGIVFIAYINIIKKKRYEHVGVAFNGCFVSLLKNLTTIRGCVFSGFGRVWGETGFGEEMGAVKGVTPLHLFWYRRVQKNKVEAVAV